MSALDKLVSQDDDDEFDDSEASESSGSDSEKSDEEVAVVSTEAPQQYEELQANKAFYKLINGREKQDMEPEEWAKVVRQYYRQPTTELERYYSISIIWNFFSDCNILKSDMHYICCISNGQMVGALTM